MLLFKTVFTCILFLIGVVGVMVARKNVIIIMMSIELMLLAVDLVFVVYSVALKDMMGQYYSMFVLSVAAAEAAVGLAILVLIYRHKGSISSLFSQNIKG